MAIQMRLSFSRLQTQTIMSRYMVKLRLIVNRANALLPDLPVPAESARCNCGSSATICTMVLGLDIDAGGTQRVLFDDASSGHVRFSQSL
jgi:hypothetical protein